MEHIRCLLSLLPLGAYPVLTSSPLLPQQMLLLLLLQKCTHVEDASPNAVACCVTASATVVSRIAYSHNSTDRRLSAPHS